MRESGTGEPTGTDEYEVVIVGGGPAGCSAGLFTARAGLDTVIFDRGRSSLRRCGHLENYLGFPAGIDIESFYGRVHDHARTAGCEIVADLVEEIERRDDRDGFVVRPQEGDPVSARRVVAATRYGGEYLRGLDDEKRLFETESYGDHEHERVDRAYAGEEGQTPISGLYIASPSEAADAQAIVAAGHGARVGRRVIADAKRAEGWWESVADRSDWVRREAELGDEWADRDRWVEWFDNRYGREAPVDTDSEQYERVRESAIDAALASYIGREEIASRAETAHEAIARRIDPERITAAVDEQALLEAMDDEAIQTYAETLGEQRA